MTCDGCGAALTPADLAARGPARQGRHPDVLATAAARPWSWCAECLDLAWWLLSLEVAAGRARQADGQGRQDAA